MKPKGFFYGRPHISRGKTARSQYVHREPSPAWTAAFGLLLYLATQRRLSTVGGHTQRMAHERLHHASTATGFDCQTVVRNWISGASPIRFVAGDAGGRLSPLPAMAPPSPKSGRDTELRQTDTDYNCERWPILATTQSSGVFSEGAAMTWSRRHQREGRIHNDSRPKGTGMTRERNPKSREGRKYPCGARMGK
jgi:hypothetical protein